MYITQNYFVSLHPERVVKCHDHSYCPCIRAPAVLLLENEATRFCLELSNLENSKANKTGYDGSRIYVGLSSQCLFARQSRA